MRPFLMADPVSGLYFEDSAPDWRFAFFTLLMGAVVLLRRANLPKTLTLGQGVTALGMVAMLYLWTFVSGNGRYFSWALLVIGPLLVMACLLLPAGRGMRWTVLLFILAMQGVVLHQSRTVNPWAAVRATDTPLPLDESPLRQKPAVFLTVSNLSYSILVPQFHQQSRWSNIAGQYNILEGTLEWKRLQGLLSSPLPKYLVTPVRPADHDPLGQPFGQALDVLNHTLSRFGLALVPGGCVTLASKLPGPNWQKYESQRDKFGFWVCSLQGGQPMPVMPRKADSTSLAKVAALDAVERRCPRFFPPGGGQASLVDGAYLRKYPSSDVRLWVHPAGVVMFQYFRALNATNLGPVDEVSAGRFTLPCEKLPGRYLPFWQRD